MRQNDIHANEQYEQALLSTLVHIQTNLEGDLSLETLAERVGFSAYHFHHLFRDAIGEPVKEYVRRLRLEKGAYRLKVSEEAILRLAMDAGFKTHESFTRAFQRQFGITPNEYRNNFIKASHARKKQNQPKYIADYNMHDETGLLANGSTSSALRRKREISTSTSPPKRMESRWRRSTRSDSVKATTARTISASNGWRIFRWTNSAMPFWMPSNGAKCRRRSTEETAPSRWSRTPLQACKLGLLSRDEHQIPPDGRHRQAMPSNARTHPVLP